MVSDSHAQFALQFVDAVAYGATVLWLWFILAILVGVGLGAGLVGAKYVLFAGGTVMVGLSLFFSRPKRGHKWVDEQVGAADEDTDDDGYRTVGLFGFFQNEDEIEDPDPHPEQPNVEVPDDADIAEDPIELLPPLLVYRRLAGEDAPFGARLLASGILLVAAAWILEAVFRVGY